jgi:hypothetical protein
MDNRNNSNIRHHEAATSKNFHMEMMRTKIALRLEDLKSFGIGDSPSHLQDFAHPLEVGLQGTKQVLKSSYLTRCANFLLFLQEAT